MEEHAVLEITKWIMVKLNISIILGSVNLKFENKQTAITAEISV